MQKRAKILLLDDDQDVLALYREMLAQLTSKPEVQTATSGRRALSLLENEPFNVLISDIKMPDMDGFQVLAAAAKRGSGIHTVLMTAFYSDEIRQKASDAGVELCLEKPNSHRQIPVFLKAIEKLLAVEQRPKPAVTPNKSLKDILFLERASQNSSVLVLQSAVDYGKVYIENGEVLDAETRHLQGKSAFKAMLAWTLTSFEVSAPQKRPQTIFETFNELLGIHPLQDQSAATQDSPSNMPILERKQTDPATAHSIEQLEGLCFAIGLEIPGFALKKSFQAQPDPHFIRWMKHTYEKYDTFSQRFVTGSIRKMEVITPQKRLFLAIRKDMLIGAAFNRSEHSLSAHDHFNQILELWAS